MVETMDLNADVGEGFPDDRALLDVITSANVACGFHAGDADTMRRLCGWCAETGVSVGAQVSYRDREGFGRRLVDIGYDDLRADILEQVDLLEQAARSEGAAVGYLKPHGALYNRVVADTDQAQAVVDAAGSRHLPVLGLPGSALLEAADAAGLRTVREFFADRGYTGDATLVPRSESGALVTDPGVVADRVARLVVSGQVRAVDGSTVPVEAESICVHGDSPGAAALALAVAVSLRRNGVELRAFR